MTEYYKDKTARVYYDHQLHTLFLEYTSKVMSENQFIVINTAVLNAFLQLNTTNFVADIRRMGIISVNSQKWVLENLLPPMIKHLNGKMLFHAQLIDPSEILSKVSGANIKNRSNEVAKGFEVMQFSNEAELHDYLREFRNI